MADVPSTNPERDLISATRRDAALSSQTATAASAFGAIGQLIGPYKLLSILGEGGMGTVYLAEQTQPVRRRVALKIIKLGMDTRSVMRAASLHRVDDPTRLGAPGGYLFDVDDRPLFQERDAPG